MKPSTSLGNPYPDPTIIPKTYVADQTADYESELAVIIGRNCKNVSEEEALDYVLGWVPVRETVTLLKSTQVHSSERYLLAQTAIRTVPMVLLKVFRWGLSSWSSCSTQVTSQIHR
jgi:hypothetical protein